MVNSATFVLFCTILQFVTSEILVHLPDGTIRGKESMTYKNKTFYSFLKIPYASPPIGNLRFKPPVPPPKWDGVLDATTNTVMCYQTLGDFPTMESEDCLYLNVYTPQYRGNCSFSVMLFIYGGDFMWGNSLPSLYYGPEFFMDHDVIIVTINYRLGPFGFLSTEDHVIPGNTGLKDQLFAIKWAHANIRLFGGDPQKITIFGQSAGSASVSYQLLHKKSEGLFRAAILQSGSVLNVWSLQRKARETAFRTAGFINETFNHCNDSEELYKFLLSVPGDQLKKASFNVGSAVLELPGAVRAAQRFVYGPVLEPEHKDAFITQKMYGLIKTGNFVKVPIIIGMTSEETVQSAANLTMFQNAMATFDKNVKLIVPLDMNIKNERKLQQVGTVIRNMYTNTTFESNLASGVKYLADSFYTRSIIKHAELQSKYTNVYFYQFSYDGKLGNVSSTIKELEHGVAHAEDLKYFWHSVEGAYDNADIDSFPKPDVVTHDRLLKLWTNFAKTLNPTPRRSDLLQNIVWPTVNSGRLTDFLYLDINNNLRICNRPKDETYPKWEHLYRTYGEGIQLLNLNITQLIFSKDFFYLDINKDFKILNYPKIKTTLGGMEKDLRCFWRSST